MNGIIFDIMDFLGQHLKAMEAVLFITKESPKYSNICGNNI